MNQTVFDYCQAHHLEQTRSRAYKKNDQAWVEQKNGAIVRRLVGYGRLSGMAATQALAQLYAAARLYTNFFQPCFKLKSKYRDGARVIKTYYPPQTPCERLLALPEISASTKAALLDERHRLDPVRLLHDIRNAQRVLAEFCNSGAGTQTEQGGQNDVVSFLESLATAWEHGEVRPTHRRASRADRWWRTRDDPFEHAWPLVEHWLGADPTVSAKAIMARLAATMPDVYAGTTQLRTLQRRIKDWRTAQAKALVLEYMHNNGDFEAAASKSLNTDITIDSG